jgi:hypothetical protein
MDWEGYEGIQPWRNDYYPWHSRNNRRKTTEKSRSSWSPRRDVKKAPVYEAEQYQLEGEFRSWMDSSDGRDGEQDNPVPILQSVNIQLKIELCGLQR